MKIVLTLLLLIMNLQALDQLSTIEPSNQKVLDSVLKKLDLADTSQENKENIYKKFKFALDKDWYIKILSNSTPAKSKVENADTKFVDLTVIDEERVYSFTFIHFKKEKQVFVISKQLVPADSALLLKKFNEYKSKEGFEKNTETDKYAFFSEKDYMSYVAVHIPGKEGIFSYIDMGTVTIK